jgi:hypothetical protein
MERDRINFCAFVTSTPELSVAIMALYPQHTRMLPIIHNSHKSSTYISWNVGNLPTYNFKMRNRLFRNVGKKLPLFAA